MNFTEDMFATDFHVPEIEIVNKDSIQLTTNIEQLPIQIKVSDSKYNLDRINVWVNGVPLYGANGINLRSSKIATILKNLPITLSRGENKIEVSALNEKGAESLKETVFVKYSPTNVASLNLPTSDLYLITIGASEYQQSKFNLTYAAKDAMDLTDLITEQKSKYKSIHTIQILNKNVTKENIVRLKDSLLQSYVDDVVIVFYAGHGLLDENLDYYLATYSINMKKPAENGLLYDDLENLLDGIPARKKLLMIDACHSGEVDKEEELVLADASTEQRNIVFRGDTTMRSFKPTLDISYKNSFELMKELFADLRRGTGAVVISSAGGGEYAYEGADWKNGVFTYSLLEGLKSGNADTNKDGEILVSELRDYVFNQVSKLTSGKQNPTTRRDNLDYDFRVW